MGWRLLPTITTVGQPHEGDETCVFYVAGHLGGERCMQRAGIKQEESDEQVVVGLRYDVRLSLAAGRASAAPWI